jgi:hypothetical protein
MLCLQLNSTQVCLLIVLVKQQLISNRGWSDYSYLKKAVKTDCKELGEVYKVLYSQLFPDSPKLAKYRVRLEKKFTKLNTPY